MPDTTTVITVAIAVVVLLVLLYFCYQSTNTKKESLVTSNNHQFIPLPPGVEPGKYYAYNGYLWYIDTDPKSPGNYIRRPVFNPNSVETGPPADLSNVVPGPLRTADRTPADNEYIRSNWDGTIAQYENGNMRVFMHQDTYKKAGFPQATFNGNFNAIHLGMGAPFALFTNGAYAGPFFEVRQEII